MKAIVIGASLSGKTTLIKYLRKNTKLIVREIDEEVEERSGGDWPVDDDYRFNVLGKNIIGDLLKKDNIIFFTNTDYFSSEDLEKAHKKGFKIIQLHIELSELKRRNEYRMKHEGYDDFTKWLKGMVGYQEKIKSEGHIDAIIDANKPVEIITQEIIKALEA